MDDLTSELDLRKAEPPWEAVRDETERVAQRIQRDDDPETTMRVDPTGKTLRPVRLRPVLPRPVLGVSLKPATSRLLHVHAQRLAPPSPSLSTYGEQNLDLALFSGPRLWPCFPGQRELSLMPFPWSCFPGHLGPDFRAWILFFEAVLEAESHSEAERAAAAIPSAAVALSRRPCMPR